MCKVDLGWFFTLLGLFVFQSFGLAQHPRKYMAHKTDEVIQIDGLENDAAWKHAAWSNDFVDIEGAITPKYKTQVKMLWNEKYLYFFARMEEPNIWATLKQRDTVIFFNNDFEIFIDPDGDTHNYMEFEINALNTVWDLFLTKPYRNHGKVLNSWDIQGIKTAIHIDGTLNDSRDVDKCWSVEIAIPWAVLTEANSHKRIPENESWRINFSRVNWNFDLTNGRYSRKKDENGKFLPEYNWVWSPQGVINMHEPEHWGYVYFTKDTMTDDSDFEIPKDDYLKHFLYKMARKVWTKEKDKTQGSMDIQETMEEMQILGTLIKPQFEKHSAGWTIWTRSPFSNKKLIVGSDGKFLSYD